MLIQKTDGSDSLRIDIPKDSVLAENRRQAAADYLDDDDAVPPTSSSMKF
jgi:hypothetical protein